jgi:hypothetical protein
MTWTDALNRLVGHPDHPHFVRLCAEDHPNRRQRDGFRRHVIDLAGGEYPPLPTMVSNVVRAAVGFVASGGAVVGQEERGRRLGICRGCDRYDATQGRCRECGCGMSLKARLASSSCPLGKW